MDIGRERILTLDSLSRTTEYQCGDDIKLRDIAVQTLYILEVHVPLPVFLESLVRLRGVLGPYHGAVGRKSLEILVKQLLEAIATSNKEYKHEHTPENTEACKETPALVAGQSVQNFPVCINVYTHNNFFSSE